MKRFLLALIALSAGILLYGQPVQAADCDTIYDNGCLDGTYYFVTTEVRDGETAPGIQHCSTYGTIDFDGKNKAKTNETYRCHDDSAAPPVDAGTRNTNFFYNVSPDGSFTMTTHPGGETTHCQILNRGSLVLCDGTAGGSSGPLRSFQAIATEL